MYMAVMTFLYQTLDALDGKQARATGTSGPLGELFDHGCDSVNLVFMTLLGLLAVDAPLNGAATTAALCLFAMGFFVSTWEALHTGVLALPVFNGPVEGTIISIATMLVSAWRGPAWWHEPLVAVAGRSFSRSEAFVAFAICGGVLTIAGNLVTVARKVHGDALARRGTTALEAAVRVAVTAFELAPVLTYAALTTAWAWFSPTSVVDAHPHLFLLGTGFGFAHLTDRVVIAHLLKQRSVAVPWWLGAFPLAGAANAYAVTVLGAAPSFPEARFLFVFAFVSISSYLIMASFVVRDITAYLGIKCFSVPPQNQNTKTA
jgi:ethanolaminephosphotransferase